MLCIPGFHQRCRRATPNDNRLHACQRKSHLHTSVYLAAWTRMHTHECTCTAGLNHMYIHTFVHMYRLALASGPICEDMMACVDPIILTCTLHTPELSWTSNSITSNATTQKHANLEQLRRCRSGFECFCVSSDDVAATAAATAASSSMKRNGWMSRTLCSGKYHCMAVYCQGLCQA